MATDHRLFKTPFFEIEVQDATGNRRAKLPHHILRLVDKIELKEIWTNDNNDKSVMTISFLEGSREPASPAAEKGTRGLYKIPNQGPGVDMDIAGSITNRPGTIFDLRFSGNNGITFLSADEAKNGVISSSDVINVEGDTVKRLHKGESQNPVFLFKERNRLKLTWGYREDSASIRTEIYTMQIFKTSYPEKNQIQYTVIAYDEGVDLDKIVPTTKAITFGTREKLVAGDKVEAHLDQETEALIRELCEKAGMACIISPNIKVPLLDSGHRKIWFVGQSFEQFLDKLAKRHNAIYKTKINPTTGQATIFFVTEEDIAIKEIKKDKIPELFKFKGSDSIVKSINVTADFKKLTGNAIAAINNQKKKLKNIDQQSVRQFNESNNLSFSTSTSLPTVTKGTAAEAIQNSILGPNNPVASIVDASPVIDKANLEDTAAKETDKLEQRIVSLEMTTIGFTELNFGTINIQGIGLRYSGKYQVRLVTHTIDSSGYICKVVADTLSTPTGGTITKENATVNKTQLQTEMKQFVGISDKTQKRDN